MKKYLKYIASIGVLAISLVGNNGAWADEVNQEMLNELDIKNSSVTLNIDNIFNIPQIPIVFEDVIYQPSEYISYFENGLEVTLYLIKGEDEQGSEIFYAFNTDEDATSYIMAISETGSSQQRKRRGNSCYTPYSWYFHQTGYRGWNHHYAFKFRTVPSSYNAYITGVKTCSRWGWNWWGYGCQSYQVQDVKVNAKDHVPNRSKDLMFQKRDVLNYCWGSGNNCKRRIKICSK